MNRVKAFARKATWLVLFVIVIALIISAVRLIQQVLNLNDEDANSLIFSVFETVALLVSLIIAISQLKDSKEIARATFIIELNKAYVENNDYINMYNVLQQCYDGECEYKSACNDKTKCKLEFKKGEVSNYLTFFETIYILYRNGVVSLEILDDLFAYRFFLAVHSKYIQQIKIEPQPWNFKNIFCLEYEWLKYRKKEAKKRGTESVDGTTNDIYTRRPLKDLVSPEDYNELIKDVNGFE